MLQKETVDTSTLELIRKLQSDSMFSSFDLAGGTALALHIGHRKSIDIDLFTRHDFDSQGFLEYLEKEYRFQMHYLHSNTLKGIIDQVFVDLIKHDYALVGDSIVESGVRLLSKKDIAAMKVNAITGNGTRVKDFIDIFFLLKEFTFQDIIEFYSAKYGARSKYHAIKSLGYFDDIIAEDWPVMIRERELTLDKVTKTILEKQKEYLDDFF